MPLYEYRCSSCGHQQEFLQKLSDPPMTVCTACGQESLSKLLTAAGFQLKGSGWYATDFKNASKPATKSDAAKGDASKSDAPKADSTGTSETKKDSGSPACGSGGCAACS